MSSLCFGDDVLIWTEEEGDVLLAILLVTMGQGATVPLSREKYPKDLRPSEILHCDLYPDSKGSGRHPHKKGRGK